MKKPLFTLSLLFATHAIFANEKCSACGYWELEREGGSGGFLKITASKKLNIKRFHLYSRSSGETPNQGDVYGVVKIENNKARYRVQYPTECSLDFQFKKDVIFVKTNHEKTFDCGFSNGVIAEGEYLRVKQGITGTP
jgi:hypothetical protein